MPRAAAVKKKVDPRIEKIQEIAALVNKTHGAGTIVRGSDMAQQYIPRITSGSLSFDDALGGGWTVNSWHEILGHESVGKTTVVYKTIAANQALDPDWEVFWVASEHINREYAELCGCDLSRFWIMDSNVMEHCYSTVLEYLDSRSVDCVVIDSYPALVSLAEEEGTMEDNQISPGARINGKFFRKSRSAMGRSMIEIERPVTGFIINQWRDKIGVIFGDPRTSPGGRGKNFEYFTRTEMSRSEWIEILAPGESAAKKRPKKIPIGLALNALVMKNKTAPPRRIGEMDFYFAENELGIEPGSYDVAKDIFTVAKIYGVLKVQGSTYYHQGEKVAASQGATLTAIRTDEFLRESIVEDTRLIIERKKSVKNTELKLVK